jgi:uncharacterized membrane protein YphA (DoxX/SURF4 family)
MSVGLLILRLVVGLSLAAHGAQKLFGWFGGYGLAGTVAALAAGLIGGAVPLLARKTARLSAAQGAA